MKLHCYEVVVRVEFDDDAGPPEWLVSKDRASAARRWVGAALSYQAERSHEVPDGLVAAFIVAVCESGAA